MTSNNFSDQWISLYGLCHIEFHYALVIKLAKVHFWSKQANTEL